MEATIKTREQVKTERALARKNAEKRAKNVKSDDLKQSKNDAIHSGKLFGQAVKEWVDAVMSVAKFIARDTWAGIGKLFQWIASKINKAGNHMDWSEK